MCNACKLKPQDVRDWMRTDKDFAQEIADAKLLIYETLASHLLKYAVKDECTKSAKLFMDYFAADYFDNHNKMNIDEEMMVLRNRLDALENLHGRNDDDERFFC